MAKKVKTLIKINIPAGAATPAPPVGTALGPHGLPIMEFVKAFNDRTADQKGTIVPAVITVYEDRTFSFIVKKSPIAEMIKKNIKSAKGKIVCTGKSESLHLNHASISYEISIQYLKQAK